MVEERELVELPQLCGKSVNAAMNELDALGIKYELSGEGEIVSTTLPLAGKTVEKGDYVLLGLE